MSAKHPGTYITRDSFRIKDRRLPSGTIFRTEFLTVMHARTSKVMILLIIPAFGKEIHITCTPEGFDDYLEQGMFEGLNKSPAKPITPEQIAFVKALLETACANIRFGCQNYCGGDCDCLKQQDDLKTKFKEMFPGEEPN